MEQFPIAKTAEGLHVEGFPDAVKVVALDGAAARKVADLALHRSDLDFALDCLEGINQVPGDAWVIRQALWRSAVTHYLKCFGRSQSRARLDPNDVYKDDVEAFEVYRFFKSLRNKHVVHDENSYSQCLPGAVLNGSESSTRISKILCSSAVGDTLEQANYGNLHLPTTRAREWVVSAFDEVCELLTSELEQIEHDELLARVEVKYAKPGPGDVHRSRTPI